MRQKWYALGSIFLLLAIFGIAGTAFLTYETIQMRKSESVKLQKIESACLEASKKFGITLKEGENISINVPQVFDPRVSMSDASAVLSYCPGYKIDEFCIGQNCRGDTDRVKMYIRISPIN